jgi:putative endonuclease
MVERPTYHVYIVTGLSLSRVLYIGVTSDLPGRMDAHRRRKANGFTARYYLWRLVCVEAFTYVRDAIAREKQLKGWRRDRKVALIESLNPGWTELRLDTGCHGGHGVLRSAQDDSKP